MAYYFIFLKRHKWTCQRVSHKKSNRFSDSDILMRHQTCIFAFFYYYTNHSGGYRACTEPGRAYVLTDWAECKIVEGKTGRVEVLSGWLVKFQQVQTSSVHHIHHW